MRVLFIYTNLATYIPPHYQHGIGSLAAVLKREGSEVALKVCEEPPERDEFISEIKEFAPDIVAFSAASNQYKYARDYSSWVKEDIGVPVIAGGVHPTMDPEGVMEHPAWDFLVMGEGEETVVELTEALESGKDPSGISNLWSRRGGKLVRNEPRALLTDLDSLPFPDRDIFDDEHLLRGRRGMMSVLTGRGCPYGCAYCSNTAYMKLYKGKGAWVRRRSPQNLVSEISELAAKYPLKLVYFDDDVFSLDKNRMLDFLGEYKANFQLPFRVNVRVETVDRQMVVALKDAGCDMLQVGVEHGDEALRRKILHRDMTNGQIERVFKWAREMDLKVWSFNMVGFPGETPELARATIELNERLRPDHMQVSVFNPYPGTPLYNECLEKGYIEGGSDLADGYFYSETGIQLPSMTPEQVKSLHRELVKLGEKLEDERRMERKYGGRKIRHDLIDMLNRAAIAQPADGYVKVDYFNIEDDARKTLQEHPVSRIDYRLKVPENSKLEFAIGVHPDVWGMARGEGVLFSVQIRPLKVIGVAEMVEVFSRRIDPRHNLDDRGWFDHSIDLRDFAGKTVELSLVTSMRNNSSSDFNTAGWANPVIVEA